MPPRPCVCQPAGRYFYRVKILHRYVLREHAGPLLFAITALTTLVLLNYVARFIGQLVGKGLPWSVLGEFVGLSVPFTVAMTFPMAVLVAVLYAFSRLASENEITAIKASGIALRSLLLPVLAAAAIVCGMMVWFNDQVLPRANHHLSTLQGDIARKKPTFSLRPRVINEVVPGKFYIFAGRLDAASNMMREVTIYDLGDATRRRTTYADSGEMVLTRNGDLQLTLFYGYVLEQRESTPDQFQRVYFIGDRVRVPGVGNELTHSDDPFKGQREMSICEMQHVLAQNEATIANARAEIARTLANGVRAAVVGAPAPLPPRPAPDVHPYGTGWQLGHLYCDGLRPLVGVDSLNARSRGGRRPPPPPPTCFWIEEILFRLRLQAETLLPVFPGEKRDGTGQGKKQLRKRRMVDAEGVVGQDNPQPAQHALQHHRNKGDPPQPAKPLCRGLTTRPEKARAQHHEAGRSGHDPVSPTFRKQKFVCDSKNQQGRAGPSHERPRGSSMEPQGQDARQHSDDGCQEPVRMLIKDPSDPFRERKEERVVAIRVGPVRHRHSHPMAGDQPAGSQQQERRQRRQQGEPVQPGIVRDLGHPLERTLL
jgi:lipopolysaccharide export LptBFGC system permease protein LptF